MKKQLQLVNRIENEGFAKLMLKSTWHVVVNLDGDWGRELTCT